MTRHEIAEKECGTKLKFRELAVIQELQEMQV